MRGSILALWLVASAGSASAGQLTTPIGSGFANACAGDAYFGMLPNPGDGFSTISDQNMTCQTTVGAPTSASASNSGAVNGFPYNNSASADASTGFIKVTAANNGSQSVPFPGGAGYGGWNDQMTITNGNGSSVWVVPIIVQGNLSAIGVGALARVGINAYENHNFLQPYGNSLNDFAYNGVFLPLNGGPSGIRNSAIAFVWDYQGVWFGAEDRGPNDPLTLQNYALNRTIYFAFPFTYGVPFEFGIYAGGVAGEQSSGGGATQNDGQYDFFHTITWGGKGQVIDQNNQTNPNFILTSQSGFDYSQPFTTATPEPATSFGILMGLSVLGWMKSRKGKSS